MHKISAVGGPVIFAFKLVRLGLVLALLIVIKLSAVKTTSQQYSNILVASLVSLEWILTR